jgi:hypothetical protein
VKGVTLHCYRYSWAERAKTAGYPERFAQEALGHDSKAVHRAYAREPGCKFTGLAVPDVEVRAVHQGIDAQKIAHRVLGRVGVRHATGLVGAGGCRGAPRALSREGMASHAGAAQWSAAGRARRSARPLTAMAKSDNARGRRERILYPPLPRFGYTAAAAIAGAKYSVDATRAWAWGLSRRKNNEHSKTIMNNGTMESADAGPRSRSVQSARLANTDDLSRVKRELLQAEVRLARARATAAAAEADIKVLGARLRSLAK